MILKIILIKTLCLCDSVAKILFILFYGLEIVQRCGIQAF